MRDAIELRSLMIPYIYTNARNAFDQGLALSYPLYYEWPNHNEAYTEKNQYYFGHNIMVVPITQPVDTTTQLAMRKLWIPPGVWIEWSSLHIYTGPLYITKSYALAETPVFVKAGSVIPMLPTNRPLLGSTNNQYTTLHLNAFCSNQNIYMQSELYEDAGNDQKYPNQFVRTFFRFTDSTTTADLTILPSLVNSPYPGMLSSRSYVIQINGLLPPQQVMVNNQVIPFAQNPDDYGWTYDSNYFSVYVNLPQQYPLSQTLQVVVMKSSDSSLAKMIPGIPRCFNRLTYVMNFLDDHFPMIYQEDYSSVADANEIAQMGMNVTALSNFNLYLQNGITQIKQLKGLAPSDAQLAIAYLSDCLA